MADTQKLAQELAELEEADWFKVLEEAQAERRSRHEQEVQYTEPKPGATTKEFAAWIAKRHLASDPAVREVIYLPGKAPAKEIRLLEVNVLLRAPEAEKAEPVDFSPDVDGLDFRVLVADITAEQWKAIQENQPLLPGGWDLRDCVRWERGKQG